MCQPISGRDNVIKVILPIETGFEAETEMLIKVASNNFTIGFVNIPTIDPKRKMSLTVKSGIALEKKRRKGKLKKFKTEKEAVKAAKARSDAGGRDRARN